MRFPVPNFIFKKWRGRAKSPSSPVLSEKLGMWQVNAKLSDTFKTLYVVGE